MQAAEKAVAQSNREISGYQVASISMTADRIAHYQQVTGGQQDQPHTDESDQPAHPPVDCFQGVMPRMNTSLPLSGRDGLLLGHQHVSSSWNVQQCCWSRQLYLPWVWTSCACPHILSTSVYMHQTHAMCTHGKYALMVFVTCVIDIALHVCDSKMTRSHPDINMYIQIAGPVKPCNRACSLPYGPWWPDALHNGRLVQSTPSPLWLLAPRASWCAACPTTATTATVTTNDAEHGPAACYCTIIFA